VPHRKEPLRPQQIALKHCGGPEVTGTTRREQHLPPRAPDSLLPFYQPDGEFRQRSHDVTV